MMKPVFNAILLLIGILACRTASGDELKFAPSVALKEEYNDNIFFSTTNKTSDFISTLTPGIELSDRSERLDANILLQLHDIMYAKTSDLNSIDQDYTGRVRFQLSPRTTLSSIAEYTLDSRPDRELATTGLVVGPTKRHRQLYSLTGERAVTELTSAVMAYTYEQDDFDNPGLGNISWHDASLALSHDFDWLVRASKGIVMFEYAHYISSSSTISNLVPGLIVEKFNFDSTIDNYSFTLGCSKAFSEIWSVQANAGARYTISKFQNSQQILLLQIPFNFPPLIQKSHDWGMVGQLAMSYKGEKTEGSLAFNSDVEPAPGQSSGTTVRTSLVTDIRHRFTYEMSGSLSVGYYRNKSSPGVLSSQAIDQDTILLTPGIRYEFNRDMYLEASYQYAKVSYNISHTQGEQNRIFIRFYIQHPFFK